MNAARQFSGDRSGAAAIVYGLTVIPFALMAGAAIDYSRASAAKSALQQATDAVALSVAVNLSPSSDLAAAQNTADKLLKARSKLPGLKILAATLSADKKKFCVTTEAGIPTAMMQLAKVEVMKASSHACAELGASGQTYEIALALDTSGSMNQSAGGMSKLQALKTAATHFINTMHAHAPGKVKMSITPFAGMVIPVDPSVTGNRALPWIDVHGLSTQHWITFGGKTQANAAGFTNRFNVFNNLKTQRADWDFGGCYEPQPYPMNIMETVPSTANPETLFVPYLAPDEPDSAEYENNYLNDDGGGCATTTTKDWTDLTRNCKYMPPPGWTSGPWSSYGAGAGGAWHRDVWSSRGGAYNGPNGMCPNAATQTVLQLTPAQSALTSKINQLLAAGDTNLHEGLMWGWRTISPNAPFGAGAAYGAPNVNKIIVLMTDGFNNWSGNTNTVGGSYYEALGYYSYNGEKNLRLPDGSRGNGVDYQNALKNAANTATSYFALSRQAQDELTAQSCANAKLAGVEIYTIGFSVSAAPIDAAGIDLLRNCATNLDHYFLATSASEIDNVFAQLAVKLQKLRLTQ